MTKRCLILAVGPMISSASTGSSTSSSTQQYAWAIISDQAGSNIAVLARDAASFTATYDALVKSKLATLGFSLTGTKASVLVYQSATACNYPPPTINNFQ